MEYILHKTKNILLKQIKPIDNYYKCKIEKYTFLSSHVLLKF